MKRNLNICYIVLGTLAICSWTTNAGSPIKKAEWLIGTWENKTQRGSIYETWNKTSDVELLGKSYMLKEKDTVWLETIRLVQEQDHLFYIPTVKNQNHGQPVRFTATLVSEDKLVFENATHDFPQTISYTRINSDSLVAEIAGIKNGKERKQTFRMKHLE